MADGLKRHVRSYDLVVRLGGDGFLCALPGVSPGGPARGLGEIEFTPVRVLEAPDNQFLAIIPFSSRGKGSGLPMTRQIAHLWKVPDGMRADRLHVFWEVGEGLETAGLPADS